MCYHVSLQKRILRLSFVKFASRLYADSLFLLPFSTIMVKYIYHLFYFSIITISRIENYC